MAAPALFAAKLKGTLLGILFPLTPWATILENTLKETNHYLELFYRLEQQAREQDKPCSAMSSHTSR